MKIRIRILFHINIPLLLFEKDIETIEIKMSAFETVKTAVNGFTVYSLKNRRQRHEVLRTLKTIHNLQFFDRVFNESLFTELIQQPTYVTPLYENSMNVILYITLIHNSPVCFVIQQYSSQTNVLHPKHRSEPSIWILPLSIPREWRERIETTANHSIILYADLILPTKSQQSSARPYLLLERVIYDGKHREMMPLSFHLETLHELVKCSRNRVYGMDLNIQLKSFYSLQTMSAKNVFDSQLQEQIAGFRFYGMKQPVIYYHNLAYKSFKVEHLDPFAIHRCRLLPDSSNFKQNSKDDTLDVANTWEVMMQYCQELASPKSARSSASSGNPQVHTIAVNMRDPKNSYGVYHVYPPYGTNIPFIKDAILRLETFEQHEDLLKATKQNPTIYLQAWIHPYFKKWSLVSRNFADNVVNSVNNSVNNVNKNDRLNDYHRERTNDHTNDRTNDRHHDRASDRPREHRKPFDGNKRHQYEYKPYHTK
jgi:hypothetical protein